MYMNSCDRDCKTCKVLTIYYLFIYRKSWFTPGIEQSFPGLSRHNPPPPWEFLKSTTPRLAPRFQFSRSGVRLGYFLSDQCSCASDKERSPTRILKHTRADRPGIESPVLLLHIHVTVGRFPNLSESQRLLQGTTMPVP